MNEKNPLRFNILTIFPDIFESYTNESILKKAQENNYIQINPINLRDFTTDKHKTVDDTPFGGGAGMVMKVEPIFRTLEDTRNKRQKRDKKQSSKTKHKTILLSAKGSKYNQSKAKELSNFDEITMICGRYEGVDNRVHEHLVDEVISVGEYVLTGGEIPALTIIDSVTRLIPGVLGNFESTQEESYSRENYIEYPQYTRPADFNGWKVPDILLSGNHSKIKEWRNNHYDKTKN